MIQISEIKYRKVSFPEGLLEAVKQFRENNEQLGYTSDVDVIKDAIREKIFTKQEEITDYIVK